MLKSIAVKILYFTAEAALSAEERKEIEALPFIPQIRNSQYAQTSSVERCDGVLGKAPDKYIRKFPNGLKAYEEAYAKYKRYIGETIDELPPAIAADLSPIVDEAKKEGDSGFAPKSDGFVIKTDEAKKEGFTDQTKREDWNNR